MATLLRMPEISANTVEAVLSEWPVAENAEFAAGDAIATVETDKAVVDVPADAAGVLLRTLIAPGRSVSVGTPMAVLGALGEIVDDIDALIEQLTGEPAATAAPAADAPTPAGTREVSQSAEPATPPATDAPSAVSIGPGRSGAGATGGGNASGRIFASPLARRIAKENGLAVGDIHGTGPGGRIVRDDVRRILAQRSAEPSGGPAVAGGPVTAGHDVAAGRGGAAGSADGHAPAAGLVAGTVQAADAGASAESAASPETKAAGTAAGTSANYLDIPHTRMRRAIANRLTRSNQEAPVFSIRGSARVDALLALRKDLNEAAAVKISVNDLIVAAAARAHVAVPEMNAIWTPDAVRRFADVDIAVAVATESGLVTPVVRGVQRLTVSALAATSADLVNRARDGKLRQDELEGGALTVTNLGVFGTEDFTAVINPPQSAILAVGAARPEAVVTDGELGIATVLRVTLSVDHRPVDGATAARWMAAFLGLVQAPLRILI
jgi:pyruvate dehydrogenase E2 component (dihydrolipoamide acetyltransferase)